MNIKFLSKRSDLLLAIFLVTIIFLMILPLPTLLVDIFIAFNIGIAIVMLMISIYMFTPLSFSSFPSVLLIATLFRLALSVTTTRLIMLEADAGDIITTFGNFVVGGNLVVGIVVFTIITVVQFIVITKGAERVAEVAARFSLDGLPGKQMSIDGDLRAGSIDAYEARRRRNILEKESQLYGSLDGAMKFVKGDAIAGIIITIINIIGGISIGTIQQGMSFGEAGRIYTILTVGDGLVNQIPALFIALSSGIIVTRVTADDRGNLGQDIGKQVFGNPRAMMMGAGAMLIFAVVPGFPSAIFMTLGVLAGGAALFKTLKQNKRKLFTSKFIDASDSGEATDSNELLHELPFSAAISLEIAENLKIVLHQESLNKDFYDIRRQLNSDLGVTFPGVHMRYRHDLSDGKFTIAIHDVVVARGILFPDHILVDGANPNVRSLGAELVPVGIKLLPESSVWIDQRYEPALLAQDVSLVHCEQVLISCLSRVLRIHASEFIDTQEASDLTNQLKGDCSDLVRELTGVVSLQLIGEVLQNLVSENISIRNLRGICEAILKHGKDETDAKTVAEQVRQSLSRQISHKLADEDGVISGVFIGQNSTNYMRGLISESQGKSMLLPNDVARYLVSSLVSEVADQSKQGVSIAVVTDPLIRRFIRSYTRVALPMLPILCYPEIASDINVKPVKNLEIIEQSYSGSSLKKVS